jgi:hypothetical protein
MLYKTSQVAESLPNAEVHGIDLALPTMYVLLIDQFNYG